jgi:hypothetical protein
VAADAGLRFSQHLGGWDRERLTDEVVIDVLRVCERHGRLPDPAAVRELVEREWVGYADARVQTYLPVLIGRAVSTHILRCASRSAGHPETPLQV